MFSQQIFHNPEIYVYPLLTETSNQAIKRFLTTYSLCFILEGVLDSTTYHEYMTVPSLSFDWALFITRCFVNAFATNCYSFLSRTYDILLYSLNWQITNCFCCKLLPKRQLLRKNFNEGSLRKSDLQHLSYRQIVVCLSLDSHKVFFYPLKLKNSKASQAPISDPID